MRTAPIYHCPTIPDLPLVPWASGSYSLTRLVGQRRILKCGSREVGGTLFPQVSEGNRRHNVCKVYPSRLRLFTVRGLTVFGGLWFRWFLDYPPDNAARHSKKCPISFRDRPHHRESPVLAPVRLPAGIRYLTLRIVGTVFLWLEILFL
jgi:hypothetical protein